MKHTRARRTARRGVFVLACVAVLALLFLVPKAGQKTVATAASPQWSEQFGAGEVFPACASSSPVPCVVSPANPKVGDTVTWSINPSDVASYINSGNYVAHSYFGTNPVYSANPDSGSWAQHQTSITKTYTTAGTQYAALVFYTTYWATADTMTETCSVTIAAAPRLICGSANGVPTAYAPSGNLCQTGIASTPSLMCYDSADDEWASCSNRIFRNGNDGKEWQWNCHDNVSANTVSGCSAPYAGSSAVTSCTPPQVLVNGVCTTPTTTAPDLVAGAVSPSTATAGVAATISAAISNVGTASTGAGSINLFQSATDANGNGAGDIGTSLQTGALAAGNIATASLSHTFTSAGTYYVRACADKSSAGNAGAIAESNENNNCGAWTPITISNPACPNGAANSPSCDQCPAGKAYVNGVCTACGGTGCGGAGGTPTNPYGGLSCNNGANNPTACDAFTPTVTLAATPQLIDQGQSSSLSWNSTHATSCSIPGLVPSGGASGGPVSTGPLNTTGATSYQISCTGPGGTGYGSASVEVFSPVGSITANPLRVPTGGASQISWSASGVASCSVTSSSGTTLASGPAGANHAFSTGSPRSLAINGQTTYTLSCQTVGGASLTRSVTVNVTPLFQEF